LRGLDPGERVSIVISETVPDGAHSLKVTGHVEVHRLPFEHMAWSGVGDRKVERLIFVTALFDGKNQFRTGVQGVVDLRLKEATLKRISAQGVDANLSLQAPAGSYWVRQVVQEAVNGKVAAVNWMVEIR
jgi:hypothetical protein